MCKVIKFTPSTKEANISFERATSPKNSLFHPANQLNIFVHQAKVIPINIGMTNFEMALNYDGKDDEIAKAYYLRAIENKEHIADSYCNLAILENQDNPLLSLQYFIAAINEDPYHIQSIYNLGCLYLDMGNLDLAKSYFLKSIDLDPLNSSSYFNLHLVYKNLGDPDLAHKFLMRYKFITHNEDSELNYNHNFLSIST